MNRHTSLVVIIILGVLALAMIHALPNNIKRESFNDNNENNHQKVNPFLLNHDMIRLPLCFRIPTQPHWIFQCIP